MLVFPLLFLLSLLFFRSLVAAALPLLGIPGTSQAAIYGAVILIALLIDRTVRQQGIASLKRVRA